jgi:hypothetical protein
MQGIDDQFLQVLEQLAEVSFESSASLRGITACVVEGRVTSEELLAMCNQSSDLLAPAIFKRLHRALLDHASALAELRRVWIRATKGGME